MKDRLHFLKLCTMKLPGISFHKRIMTDLHKSRFVHSTHWSLWMAVAIHSAYGPHMAFKITQTSGCCSRGVLGVM
jgi:hypothetical protein